MVAFGFSKDEWELYGHNTTRIAGVTGEGGGVVAAVVGWEGEGVSTVFFLMGQFFKI